MAIYTFAYNTRLKILFLHAKNYSDRAVISLPSGSLRCEHQDSIYFLPILLNRLLSNFCMAQVTRKVICTFMKNSYMYNSLTCISHALMQEFRECKN